MPTGPGIIDDATIRSIALAAPPGVDTFLLTSRTTAADIAAHQRDCATTTIQVVTHVDVDVHAELARLLPGIRRVQVIHVEGEDALSMAQSYAPHVHALLLDSGRPSVDELGGTGRVHDWSISRRIVAGASVPVFLAGGLDPDNIDAAIREVGPYGVDLCSGLRPHGVLDQSLLERFMAHLA